MSTAVLNRPIDPSQPLADASAMLMALSGIVKATAPIVAKSTSRRARGFKRAAEATHGATQFFRRKLTPAFSLAKAPVMTSRNLQFASRLLMAGPRPRTAHSPHVSVLTMSQMRARAKMVRANAIRMIGTLRARFSANAADWSTDHRLDTGRMVGAQARFANARGPNLRFDY